MPILNPEYRVQNTNKEHVDYGYTFSGNDYMNEYDKFLYSDEMHQGYNRSANQSGLGQIWNGLVSRSASILPKIGAGVGSVYGAATAALTDKEMDYIWTNPFTVAMNEADEALKEWAPVYKSRQYAESGLLGKMMTTSMWADDFLDGAAFMASAFVPGIGISKGLNGLGSIANGSKALTKGFKALGYADKAADYAENITNFGRLATINVYNTIAESGAEAYQTNKEIAQLLRDLHPEWSEEDIKMKAGEAASRTFNWNLAALLIPNMVETTMFHGKGALTRQAIRKSIFESGQAEALKASSQILKKAGLGLLTEGLFEENIQGAIQHYERMYATDPLNTPDMAESIASTMWTGVKGFVKSFTPMETSKLEDEQALAIALGGILGGGMGVISGIKETSNINKVKEEALSDYKKFFDEIAPAANKMFTEGVGNIYKKDGTYKTTVTKSDGTTQEITIPKYLTTTDKDGNIQLVMDEKALASIVMNMLRDKTNLTVANLASMKEDAWMDEHHKEMMLASYAFELFKNQQYSSEEAGILLSKLTEIGTQEAKDLGINTYISENMSKVKSYITEMEDNLSKFFTGEESSQEDKNFNNTLFRGRHFLRARLNSLNKLRSSTTNQKTIEDLDKLIEDTSKFINLIDNNKSEFRKEYDSTIVNNEKLLSEFKILNDKKDRTAEETEKLDELQYLVAETRFREGDYFMAGLSRDTSALLNPKDLPRFTINENPIFDYTGKKNSRERIIGLQFMGKERVNEMLKNNEDPRTIADVIYQTSLKDDDAINEVTARLETDRSNNLTTITKINALIAAKDIYENVSNEAANYADENGVVDPEFVKETLSDLFEVFKDDQGNITLEGQLFAEGIGTFSPNLFDVDNQENILKNFDRLIQNNIQAAQTAKDNIMSADLALKKLEVTKDNKSKLDTEAEQLKNSKTKYGENDINGLFLEETILNPFKIYENIFNSSPDNLYDLDEINNFLVRVKAAHKIWVDRDDKVAKELEDIIEKITKDIVPTIINNLQSWEGKQIASINELINTSLLALGINLQSNTFYNDLTSPDILKLIESIIGKDILDNILQRAISEQLFNYDIFKVLIEALGNKSTDEQKKELELLLNQNKEKLYSKFLELVGDKFKNLNVQLPSKEIFLSNPNSLSITVINALFPDNSTNPELSRLFQYLIDLDFVGLLKDLDKIKEISREDKDLIARLYYIQNIVTETNKLLLFSKESFLINKFDNYFKRITPSPQQNIVLTELLAFINSNTSWDYFNNWAIVDGLPGSGKTSAVSVLIPELSKISKDEILAFSANDLTSANIAKVLNTKQVNLNEVLNADLSKIKLLVIDEIYTFTQDEILMIREKTKGLDIKIIALGDPSQRSNQSNPLFKQGFSKALITTTLTASYRTNVGAIGSFIENYKLKSNRVSGLFTTTNFTGTEQAMNDVLGVAVGSTIDDLIDTLNIPSDRSRVVIVANESEVSNIRSIVSSKGNKIPDGIQILSIDKVQGLQWDEVYTYLPYDLLSPTDALNKNRDLYTAFSRAKSFLFVVDDTLKMYPPDVNINNSALDNSEQIKANVVRTRDNLEQAKEVQDLLNGVKSSMATPHIEKQEDDLGPAVDTENEVLEYDNSLSDEVTLENTNTPEEGTYNDEDGLFYPTNYALSNKKVKFKVGQDLYIVKSRGKSTDKNKNYYFIIGVVDGRNYVLGMLGDRDFKGKHGEYFTNIVKAAENNNGLEYSTFTKTKDGFIGNITPATIGTVKLASYSAMKQVTLPFETSSTIDDIIIKFYNSYFGTTNGVTNYPAEVDTNQVDVFGERILDFSKQWVIDGRVNWDVVKDKVEIRIMNEKDLSEYPDELNIAVGAPYLIIKNPAQLGGTSAKDILIPLNAKPLSDKSEIVKDLRSLHNSFKIIDEIAPGLSLNSKLSTPYGDNKLSEIYDAYAKANFTAVDRKTITKNNIVKSISDIAPELTNGLSVEQIQIINEQMDNIIRLIYAGEYKTKLFDTEQEAKDYAKDRAERIELRGKKYIVILKSTEQNGNDVQELKEWRVVAGEGVAQHHLNNLARSNSNISLEDGTRLKLRRVTHSYRKGKGIKLYNARSILSNSWYIDYKAFYNEFGNKHGIREIDIMIPGSDNKYVAGSFNILVNRLKKLKNPDGTFYFSTSGKTFSNPQLQEEDILANVNRLLEEFAVLPWTLDTLETIVDPKYFNGIGEHSIDGFSLKTPLSRSNFYKTGINDLGKDLSDISTRAKLGEMLNHRYAGTQRTRIAIELVDTKSREFPVGIENLISSVANILPKELFDLINNNVDKNINVVYVDGKLSSYDARTNTISLSNQLDFNNQNHLVLVAHELIHALVNKNLFSGLQENATPQQKLFVERIRAIKKELDPILDSNDLQPTISNSSEFDELAEFLASMSRPQLWNKLEETTIFDTISKIFKALLELLGVKSAKASRLIVASIEDVYKQVSQSTVNESLDDLLLGIPESNLIVLADLGYLQKGKLTSSFLELSTGEQQEILNALRDDNNSGISYGYFEEEPIKILGLPGMIYSSANINEEINKLGLSNFASNILTSILSNTSISTSPIYLNNLIGISKDKVFIEYLWDNIFNSADRLHMTTMLKSKDRQDLIDKLYSGNNEYSKSIAEVIKVFEQKTQELSDIIDSLSYEAGDMYVSARALILEELFNKMNPADNLSLIQTSTEILTDLNKSLPARKALLLTRLDLLNRAMVNANPVDKVKHRLNIENTSRALKVIDILLSRNIRTNKPIFIEIVNDIYPRAKYKNIAELENFMELADDKKLANISEHEKTYNTNAEKTLSESIKDLVSMISYTTKDGKLMFVNPSTAYIKLMDFIVDKSMEDLDKLIEEIDIQLSKQLALTSRAVYEKLKSVIQTAIADVDSNAQLIPNNVAVVSEIDKNGKLYYRVVIADRPIKGIVETEIISDYTVSPKFTKTSDLWKYSGLSITDFNNVFRRDEAINYLRELMGAMGSMSENDLLVGRWSRNRGKLDIVYSVSKASGINFSFKEEINQTLEKYYDEGKFKELESLFQSRYPQSHKVLYSDLDRDQDNAEQRYKTVKAIYEFLGLRLIDDIVINQEDAIDIIAKFKYLLSIAQSGVKLTKSGEEENEQVTESNLMDFEDFVEEFSALINKLADIAESSSDFVRNPSVKTALGDKYYKYHESTFAKDVLNKLIRNKANSFFRGTAGKRLGVKFPEFLNSDLYENNIFKTGLVKLLGIYEHEALHNSDVDTYIPISRENKFYYFYREFMMGFLDGIRQGTSSNSYYLYSYPPSDKPKYPVFKVSFLSDSKGKTESEVEKALRETLKHFIARKGLSLDIKNMQNLKDPYRNFNLVYKAEKILNQELDETNIDQFIKTLKDLFVEEATKITKDLVEMKFKLPGNYFDRLRKSKGKDGVSILDSINTDVIVTDENNTILWDNTMIDELRETSDRDYINNEKLFRYLFPAVLAYFQNHYLSSFHVTQLFSGDFASYKNTEDIVKRFAGMLAPGIRGLVHPTIGMREEYNLLIVNDISIDSETTTSNLQRVIFGDRQLTPEEEIQFNKFKSDFKSYNIADGQGFMLPSRAAEIEKGFGKAFGVGKVMKPVHYELRKVKADMGDKTYTTAVPIYTKYSSIVLTEDLIKSFPFLEQLRNKMVELEVDELLMDTAIKVGLPLVKDIEGNDVDFTFDKFFTTSKKELSEMKSSPMLKMSNRNFRLQLNPDTDINKEVSMFTQLMYFLNITEADKEYADSAYNAVAEIIKLGIEEFKDNLTPNKLRGFLIKKFTGPSSERALDLLVGGVSTNNPMLVKKAIVAIATELQNKAISVKFTNGGKWVLQSPVGIEKYKTFKPANDNSTELSYRQETSVVENKEHKIISAEVIVPRQALTNEQIIAMQKGESIFLYNEGLGFRIPSTELHSAVSLRVVGVHDLGSNTIIAPKELIAIQGSDQPFKVRLYSNVEI